MDKKTVIILLVAFFLALLASFFILKKDKNIEQEIPALTTQEVQVDIKKALVESFSEEIKKEEVNPQINVKPVQQAPVKKEDVKSEAPEIKPLQVEEQKTLSNTEGVDAGVLKEVDTNTIVITREFKSEAPAKYSFK